MILSQKVKDCGPGGISSSRRRVAHGGRRAVHGFTLIELLVVIAILSLLVSILLPSLQKAKLLARRVLCLTRFKSIGSVYYLYMNDNHDQGPMGFTYGWTDSRKGTDATGKFWLAKDWSKWPPPDYINPYGDPDGDVRWYGWFSGRTTDRWDHPCWALGEYLGINKTSKSKFAVACPNYEDLVNEDEGGGNAQTTYAVNYYLGYNTHLGDHLKKPASSPMLMDGVYDHPDEGIKMNYTMFPRPTWGDGIDAFFVDMATLSHEGSGNFLFFDGHAENQAELETALDYVNLWTFYGD
ncbi:MAG: prepilin-type N-terminal cleavage/methylation domain-containing protein [Phycisphaerae bacterium]|nr:prepilin-type N-terminal cleavage/methylation domain-containing protein [Phycisphaerae bacterium]